MTLQFYYIINTVYTKAFNGLLSHREMQLSIWNLYPMSLLNFLIAHASGALNVDVRQPDLLSWSLKLSIGFFSPTLHCALIPWSYFSSLMVSYVPLCGFSTSHNSLFHFQMFNLFISHFSFHYFLFFKAAQASWAYLLWLFWYFCLIQYPLCHLGGSVDWHLFFCNHMLLGRGRKFWWPSRRWEVILLVSILQPDILG